MLLENQVITWAEMIEHKCTSSLGQRLVVKIACIRLRKAIRWGIPLNMTTNRLCTLVMNVAFDFDEE